MRYSKYRRNKNLRNLFCFYSQICKHTTCLKCSHARLKLPSKENESTPEEKKFRWEKGKYS